MKKIIICIILIIFLIRKKRKSWKLTSRTVRAGRSEMSSERLVRQFDASRSFVRSTFIVDNVMLILVINKNKLTTLYVENFTNLNFT